MAASEDMTVDSNKAADPEKEKALANSQITNSEEQKLIKARIFVGNLPADLRTEKGELYDKFRKHGRIMGVSIHSRFAFVQFENEGDARAAVKEENHSDFRAAKLEIKMAIEGRAPNRGRDDRDRRRSRSPVDRRRDSRDRDRGGRRDSRDRDRDRRDSRGRDSYRRRSRTRSPSPYIPAPVETRFCHPRTYGANDVELVVIRKQQGHYAETILNRLYQCNITANVLFLAEHAALDGAVNEFGRCGTHYVIIIMPKHEETRALTINMFEGADKPREYRNMGIDEGVAFINRHFNEHYPALARLRMAEIQGPNFYPPAPVEVARTLTRVAEMSAVPTSSLDSTIRYLQEMRERTAAFEGLAPQPVAPPATVVQSAYASRGMEMETGIGKPYSGMDDRTRLLGNSDSDSIRESLLGLLKATGGLAGIPGVQAGAMSAPNAYNPGSGAFPAYAPYPAYPSSTGSSQVSNNMGNLASLTADPAALQKALASLGVLAPSQSLGSVGASQQHSHQSQQGQQQSGQREPATTAGGATSYRSGGTAVGGQSHQSQAEDNGPVGYGSQQQNQQVSSDRTSDRQYGQASQQFVQNGHSQQQHLTSSQMSSLRSVGGGSGGGQQVNNGQQSSLYAPSGRGGAGVVIDYMQPQQSQAQQPIQRAMQQQQQTQQATGYSGVPRR